MKLDECGKLLVSWASFLNINENIATIEDLCTSGLFPRLLKAVQAGNETGDSKGYFSFLEEQFNSLSFSGHNREIAILHTLAFLIYCSLHHPNNNLPQKMINLPHLTWCQSTNFLQEFVEVPKSMTTREIIFTKVPEICSIGVLERSSVCTPPNFVTPVTYTPSPATEEMLGSRINSSTKKTSWGMKLKRDINKSTNLKVEINEELDSAKKCIAKLECEMREKNAEISNLKSEIKKAKEVKLVSKKHKANDNLKIENLKATIEDLTRHRSELEETIMLYKNEKDRIFDKEIEITYLNRNIHDEEITSRGKVVLEVQKEFNKPKNSNKEKVIIKTEQVKNLEKSVTGDLEVTKDNLVSEKIQGSSKSEIIKELKHKIDQSTEPGKTKQVSDNSQKLEDLLTKSDLETKKLKENYITEKTKLTKELNCLKNEYENLKVTKEKLNQELVNVKIIHSGCEERKFIEESLMAELKEREYSLNQHIIKYKENEEAFKQDISDKNNAISNLNYEIGCLKKLVSSYEYENGNLNTKLKAKETDIHKLELSLVNVTKQFEVTKGKFKEEIELKLLKIHDLDSTISKFKDQCIQAQNEKDSLTIEVENSKIIENDLKLLQKKFQSQEEENISFKQESVLKNEEISQLKSEIQVLKMENENKNNILQDNTKILNETKFEVKTLQGEIIDCKLKEKTLIEQLGSNNNTIASLEQYIKLNDAKLKEAISEIGSLKETVKKKDDQIESFCKEKNDLELDMNILSKKNEISSSILDSKKNEIQEVFNKLNKAESEITKLSLKKTELEHNLKDLHNTIHSQNIEISEKNNEIEVLQKEYKNVIQQLSEERAYKHTQIHKMKTVKEEQGSKLKSHISEADYKDRIEQLNCTHEKKVLALKSAVKKQFTEKLTDLTSAIQNENTDLKEKLFKERGKCARFELELKNVSGKLATAQEKNRTLLSYVQANNTCGIVRPSEMQLLSPISKARSMEVLSGQSRGRDKFAHSISLDESGPSWRSTVKRCFPRAQQQSTGTTKKAPFSAGNMSPAADESGEVFDNRDLNHHFDPSRMSILQYRNTLCLPHLKSSYPVETQFISTVKEDDIKSSYKNPRPPTLSKDGGKHSQ